MKKLVLSVFVLASLALTPRSVSADAHDCQLSCDPLITWDVESDPQTGMTTITIRKDGDPEVVEVKSSSDSSAVSSFGITVQPCDGVSVWDNVINCSHTCVTPGC